MQAELGKIEAKYASQVAAYEKKGINPLTKKLMEKARNEQVKVM